MNTGIKIKNYKCFKESLQGFSRIRPINVIIGKNNSGKSSLIELIEQVVSPQKSFFDAISNTHHPEILITDQITDDNVRAVFRENTTGGPIPNQFGTHYQYGKQWVGTGIAYIFNRTDKKKLVDFEKKPPYAREMFEALVNYVALPFSGMVFKRISSERDIVQEVEAYPPTVDPKGSGATNLIQLFINRSEFDSKVVERHLLKEINRILNPEIHFVDILIQKHGTGYWEIYFETLGEDRIPLSKMGSGVKTVLLTLLNLHLIPLLEKRDKSEYIFAFEELENNLHPSLQRRLFLYLRDYVERYNCIFFLTTHSNVIIDLFISDSKSQIIHIKNENNSTVAADIVNNVESKRVLEDLDIRASDLLQTNGVIWVEGPSDRIFLNKWISLMDPKLKEGVHYSIMFYGGRLLSRVHFLPEFLDQELIPLLRINHNAYVMIDRDGKYVSDNLNRTKTRIQKEVGEESCWITDGREIENYLTKETIEKWTGKRGFKANKYSKFDNLLSSMVKKSYEKDKVMFANEIVKHISIEDLNCLDLNAKLVQLVGKIRLWNKID